MGRPTKLAASLFVVWSVVLLSGGGVRAADSTKLSLRLDWAPHGMHAGLHLAKQKGWFQEAGLDLEIEDGKGTSGTINLVAADQVDVGFAQLSAMITAKQNGLPVIAI